ncbi:hypothetical protein NC652_039454 [Populus alba x Populus x berolinensis]|nr:hypothetical protein NC652_039454 [Populus alba x Populus x berolinensis]
MKSSALASTSVSSNSVEVFPSFTVAGLRDSTMSSSSKWEKADFVLADFFIFFGSFLGTSPEVGFVRRSSKLVAMTKTKTMTILCLNMVRNNLEGHVAAFGESLISERKGSG